MRLRDYHPLWCHFPKDFGSARSIPRLRPRNPGRCPARFGLFPVRSPLLRESRLISSPPGTEMFQFPGLLGYSGIDARWAAPPDIIAAFHARILMTPRHPPRALRSLTTPIGPPPRCPGTGRSIDREGTRAGCRRSDPAGGVSRRGPRRFLRNDCDP